MDIPDLKFRVIHGGLFKIKATVKNEGISEANDVNWEINIEGGSIVSGRSSTGVIDTIAPGESVTISTKSIIGFGEIQALMTVDGPECHAEITRGGNVFLFYVKVNPGGG